MTQTTDTNRTKGQRRPSRGPTKLPLYRDLTLLQLAVLVFLLDQFTKFLVVSFLPNRGDSFPEFGFLRFTHVHNTGSAFGILQGWNTPLILVSFLGVFVLIMIYQTQPRPSNLLRISLALQLGGAFGNLLDRLRLGWVTDFVDVGPWPVFNVADASIVCGLLLLGWILTHNAHSEPREVATDPDPGTWSGSEEWCPICDGEMTPISGGWHCTTCGVKERLDGLGAPGAVREEEDSTRSSHL